MAIKQPSDKSHFILPDLGEGVHEAELIKWRVQPGETVDEHQTLAEMETDKALVEVPSPWPGTIRELHGNEGDIINVGSTLVSYVAGSESTGGSEPAPTSDDSGEREDAGTVVGSVDAALTVSDRFTQRRHDGNGVATRRRALATPAVRRIARAAGVDINQVPGTGRGGRVTASDIQMFVGGGGVAGTSSTAVATPTAPAGTTAAATR